MPENKNKTKKYIYYLVLSGLIIAIEIILERYLVIEVTTTSRYSLAFIARAISGAILGPIGAGITGIIADALGATIKFGSPIWLLCITAFIRGVIYGIFLHKKCSPLRIVLAVLCVEIFCSVLLNSLILHYSFQTDIKLLLITRSIQAGIMTAVQIPILLLMNKTLFPILKKMAAQQN